MIEVEEMRAGEIDLTKLGDYFFRLALIAVQAGHTSPRETLLYLHPTTLEGTFMRELLGVIDLDGEVGSGSFERFLDKWFGGEDGARLLLKRIFDERNEDAADA